jgi:hypothetical protein
MRRPSPALGRRETKKNKIFKVLRERKCTTAGTIPPQEYLNIMQRQSRMENTQKELRNKDGAVEREEEKWQLTSTLLVSPIAQ